MQVPLFTDTNDPTKYASVTVENNKLNDLLMKARSKGPQEAVAVLVNGLIDLVFTRETLAGSRGLGLRVYKVMNKEGVLVEDNRPALDKLAVEAIRGKP